MSQNQIRDGETSLVSETVWKCRPQTLDVAIYNSIVRFNEYRLPDALSPEDIVIDVGAHIGSFSQATALRGCQHVFSIEPDCENFEIACENLKPYIVSGFVKPIRAAVWRSDANDDQLYFDGYHPFPDSYPGMQGIMNTGSGSVVWGMGTERVPKVALDDIIDQATNCGSKRIGILKLDCEGAEWPILLTSRRLHLIDQICGEFHEFGGEFIEISERVDDQPPLFQIEGFDRFTIEELVRVLGDSGFDVSPDAKAKTATTDVCAAPALQTSTDLARLRDCWPNIPECVRASILLLAEQFDLTHSESKTRTYGAAE